MRALTQLQFARRDVNVALAAVHACTDVMRTKINASLADYNAQREQELAHARELQAKVAALIAALEIEVR